MNDRFASGQGEQLSTQKFQHQRPSFVTLGRQKSRESRQSKDSTQPRPLTEGSLPSAAYFRRGEGDKNIRHSKRTRERMGRPWARICLCLLYKQSKMQPDKLWDVVSFSRMEGK